MANGTESVTGEQDACGKRWAEGQYTKVARGMKRTAAGSWVKTPTPLR
jgi:hypothetical protein